MENPSFNFFSRIFLVKWARLKLTMPKLRVGEFLASFTRSFFRVASDEESYEMGNSWFLRMRAGLHRFHEKTSATISKTKWSRKKSLARSGDKGGYHAYHSNEIAFALSPVNLETCLGYEPLLLPRHLARGSPRQPLHRPAARLRFGLSGPRPQDIAALKISPPSRYRHLQDIATFKISPPSRYRRPHDIAALKISPPSRYRRPQDIAALKISPLSRYRRPQDIAEHIRSS